MSEAKFTKGKWFVDNDMTIMTDDSKADDDMICDMMPVEMNETEIANAHLIASAPEMYDMLRDILKNYECGSVVDEQIEKVLAKARGEL